MTRVDDMAAIDSRIAFLEEAMFKIDEASTLVRRASREASLSRCEQLELLDRIIDLLEEVDPGNLTA